jgi:hypothetical protein
VHDLIRTRKLRKGKTEEVHLSVTEDSATIVVTADLPDEARLALLDLHVGSEEFRGKLLRWDTATSTWRVDAGQQDLETNP